MSTAGKYKIALSLMLDAMQLDIDLMRYILTGYKSEKLTRIKRRSSKRFDRRASEVKRIAEEIEDEKEDHTQEKA